MNITLFNFSKRKNSTLQPTGGIDVDVKLKSECSIYSPSFLIQLSNIDEYNYIKWSNRYYYIADCIKVNADNVYRLECSIDLLATFKEQINNTKVYVKYSASRYDPYIVDDRLSSDEKTIVNSTSSSGIISLSGGYYVINYVTSAPPSDLAPTGVIYLPKNQVGTLNNILMGDGFSNFLKNIEKQLTDAKSAIISAKYVPLNLAGSGSATMQLGSYTAETCSGNIPRRYWKNRCVLDIPFNFADFRNSSKFTSMYLFLPAYGFVELNPDLFIGTDSLIINYWIDGITFECTYVVENVGQFTTKIAQEINLGVNKQDAISALSAGASILAGATIGGGVGALASAGSVYGAVTNTLQQNIGTVGNLGGIASICASNFDDDAHAGYFQLFTLSHSTNVDPASIASTIGRPLNQIKRLNTLSGYCQTVNASVDCVAPENLKEELNSLLDGGIYLE